MDTFGHFDRRGLFLVVEGNISAGKTTFCKKLADTWNEQEKKTELLIEPNENPLFNALLQKYYHTAETRARWAYTLQITALALRFKQHLVAAALSCAGTHVVQDRSIFADSCFGAACFEAGSMEELEWCSYRELFGIMKHNMRYPDVMLYLRTSPERCWAVNNKRALEEAGRDIEEGIPLEYFQHIHLKHEELADKMKKFTRVLTIDWNEFGNGKTMWDVGEQIMALAETDVAFIRDTHRL